MSEPIRVLHICESFDPGGVVWWLIDMAKSIVKERFHFDFYCCGRTPGMRAHEVQELGCDIALFQPTVSQILLGSRLRSILKSNHYDIVHAHIFNQSGWWLRHAAAMDVPVRIAHYHNTRDGRRATLPVKVRRQAGRLMASIYANAVLACSGPALQNAPTLKGCLARRVLHYGIDLEAFTSIPGFNLRSSLGLPFDTPIVGHVGRFVTAKNHQGLISIFRMVLEQVPNAQLLLVGDGPLLPEVAASVASSSIAKSVIFAGARSDVADFLPQLDVFAFPSFYEGLPVALIEARMSGTPVVASSLPAIGELMEGCNGYCLARSDDHTAFAQRIANFLSPRKRILPPEEWKAAFSCAKSSEKLACLYEQLLTLQPA